MTLEEIKDLVYPKVSVDWADVLKELVLIKFGEDKLIKFRSVYLCNAGDGSIYVCGVAVINGRLFAMSDDGDGYDNVFGTAHFGRPYCSKKGIGLTENAAKSVCKLILEDDLSSDSVNGDAIVFDFSEMKAYRYWFDDYFLEALKEHEKEFESFKNGESSGCIWVS